MALKKAKNLLQEKSIYAQHYGNFRGVDFSSDPTQVREDRMPYAVNMFRDYQNGAGGALETVPGFRMLRAFGAEIFAIHVFRTIQGNKHVLVHSGNSLYLHTVDTEEKEETLFSEMNAKKSISFTINNRLYLIDGKNFLVYDGENLCSVLDQAYIPTTYIGILPGGVNADAGEEHEQRNLLQPRFKNTFVPDGISKEFYLSENGLDSIESVTLYGVEKTEGEDYDVDVKLGKVTFKDGCTPPAAGTVNAEEGEEIDERVNSDSSDDDKENAKNFPRHHAGLEIVATKQLTNDAGLNIERDLLDCTVGAIYDGRLFLSGNPNLPNRVFYCTGNSTGHTDPTYFGILNYVNDGVGTVPIRGMMTVANTLLVLKGEGADGTAFFHTPMKTGIDIVPITYPPEQGLPGRGCVGGCIGFLDDPIFISRLGVEAIGQLSARYERAIEHRSSLIDARLCNLKLDQCATECWNGYLLLLLDGKIFMADSRQIFTHESGVKQYEWYYLEDIGIYAGQFEEFVYSPYFPYEELKVKVCKKCGCHEDSCKCGNKDKDLTEISLTLASDALQGECANPSGESLFEQNFTVDETSVDVTFATVAGRDPAGEKILTLTAHPVEKSGRMIGGTFSPACILKEIDGNLFFGTEGGHLCCFNFDRRDEDGVISPTEYTFNDRTIFSGFSTKLDHCGIPHLTKSTVKRSTVIKTRAMQSSGFSVKVRTDKRGYERIAGINATRFSFENMDFADLSFITSDQSLFAVKEKEKKWMEKQYFLYSDKHKKPFAVQYLSYRYHVAGRYKE